MVTHAPTQDRMKRFLEMSDEEAGEARKIILDELWKFMKKDHKELDPLLMKLKRTPDGRWRLSLPGRRFTEREKIFAPTWGDTIDRQPREIEVTDWAEAMVHELLLRIDDRARKLGFKRTALLCRADMNDDEFVQWAEEVLALLLCKRS